MSAAALILFWPEAAKTRYQSNKPSILIQLSAIGVWKLFAISIRTSKIGRHADSKKTMQKLAMLQLAKFAYLFIVTMFLYYNFIIINRLEYLYVALYFLTIFPEWVFWDEKKDRALKAEVLERAFEFGLDTVPAEVTQTPETVAARGETQNFSASRERTEIDMEDEDRLFERIDGIAKQGRKYYAMLQENLEHEHWGKCICINADTGEFVLGDTLSDVHKKFDDRFGADTPAYNAKIGIPTRVGIREWAL